MLSYTPLQIPVQASGFERDPSVFPMLGITCSNPQVRKPKKLTEGKITSVHAHAQQRILTLLNNGILGCSGIERTRSLVLPQEVTESPIQLRNWCPPCLPVARCQFSLPMYPFTRPLSLACMLLRLVGLKIMWVRHPEPRAGLATVRGWYRVRESYLFQPTPPHNLSMHSGPETQKTHTFHYKRGLVK